jgi:hypothetical protein
MVASESYGTYKYSDTCRIESACVSQAICTSSAQEAGFFNWLRLLGVMGPIGERDA